MSPRLQIALDTASIADALTPLNQAIAQVDVIECGTILILHEGLRAVREIRALYPDATILADVRIAEAGSIIATACFEAGASWVSCVAGASMTTIEQVVAVARRYHGQVQVELNDDHYTLEKAIQWRELGVDHVIVKRSRDQEAQGILTWGPHDLERIAELKQLGFTVSITGGINPNELDTFADSPVDIVIAGRSILGADDPAAAAAKFQDAFTRVWSQ